MSLREMGNDRQYHKCRSRFTVIVEVDMSDCGPPKLKRARRQCHFDFSWLQQFPGIGRSSKGKSSNKVVVIYYFLASTTNFV